MLTDNGSCYKSRLWRDVLAAAGITHKRTRAYRPQTNGKVERFNRTLLDEWAYARPYRSEQERRDAFPDWLHTYNHHRGLAVAWQLSWESLRKEFPIGARPLWSAGSDPLTTGH